MTDWGGEESWWATDWTDGSTTVTTGDVRAKFEALYGAFPHATRRATTQEIAAAKAEIRRAASKPFKALCRYCGAPRPNGYAVTCGRSECQEAAYRDSAAQRKQKRRKRR